MLECLLIERVARKFCALIGSYRRRIAMKQSNAVQNINGLSTRNPESGVDCQAFLHNEGDRYM